MGRKWLVWPLAFGLSLLTTEIFFPEANIVNAGAARMVVLILLTVAFKAAIEFVMVRLSRRQEPKRDNSRP